MVRYTDFDQPFCVGKVVRVAYGDYRGRIADILDRTPDLRPNQERIALRPAVDEWEPTILRIGRHSLEALDGKS